MDKRYNVQVCKENNAILKANGYTANGKFITLPHSLEKQQRVVVLSPEIIEGIVTDEDDFFEKAFYASKECVIEVKNIDSFAEKTDLVMNFASATHPGGGYLKGSNAQEECLCRQSSLYASLSSFEAREMYDFNYESNSQVYSDYMLLSPTVDVFRNILLDPLEEPYTTAVMTVPAPNLNGRAAHVPQKEIEYVMEDRIRNFLMCAARYSYRRITLGAWGCGAFGHNPKNVAKMFRNVIEGEGLYEFFDYILFAVLDRSEDKANFMAFSDTFSDIPVLKATDLSSSNNTSDEKDNFLGWDPYYILTNKPMPICNHTECVSKDNIGYCQGIFEDGTPFEAELYKAEEEVGLALIMPLLDKIKLEYGYDSRYCNPLEDNVIPLPKNHIPENFEAIDDSLTVSKEEKNTPSKVKYLQGQSEYTDNSILWIGMALNGVEEDISVLQDYVDYLKDNEVIRFTSPLENCAIFYCTDIAGHDFAKLNITLKEKGGAVIAETSLKFSPFKDNRNNLFTIVK